MDAKEVESALGDKIGLPQIKAIAAWVADDDENRQSLWQMAQSDDRRQSVNSLWVMTHLITSLPEWLALLRDSLIDMLLVENDPAKKRLLLKLLREQEYEAEDIRADFLDYCMSKINSECEPYAVRCFCMYAAFRMCRHYPELIDELEMHLDMMASRSLSPGLRSALRQTRQKIDRCRK